MDSLKGRHALVTGGGRGIGRAIAATLMRAGANVTVVGRTESDLKEATVAGDADGWIVADVTQERLLRDAIELAATARGPFDILVANAGGAESGPFAKTDADLFRRMFDLNVVGVVNATHAVLGGMRERQFGRIVVVASTAALKGYRYVTAYCAAKHAVIGLVRSLAIETATSGITVNAVCPGYTDTELVQRSVRMASVKGGRSEQAVLDIMLKDNPQGRLVRPQEVAAAALYLCLPEAAAVTGTTLAVAGGEI